MYKDPFLEPFEAKTGYKYVKQVGKFPACTHVLDLYKNQDGKLVVVKHDTNREPNIGWFRRERILGGHEDGVLKGIDGVISVLTAGVVEIPEYRDNSNYKFNGEIYVVKPYLSEIRLSDVIERGELTDNMKKQVYETVKKIHERGWALEIETRSDDWVLDVQGRPTLVDLEKMQYSPQGIVGLPVMLRNLWNDHKALNWIFKANQKKR